MSGLAFLLIALAISLIGSLILWLRSRRPRSMTSGIEEFRREMRALAPNGREQQLRTDRAPRRRQSAG